MFGLFFVLLLSACGEIDSVSFDSKNANLNCFVCKNALYGVVLTKENSCNGAFELWESTQKLICGSSCKEECSDSICSSLPVSNSCKECLLNSTSSETYLNCEMLGNE